MRYALVPGLDPDLPQRERGPLLLRPQRADREPVCGKLPISYAKLGILLAAVAVPVFVLALLGGFLL